MIYFNDKNNSFIAKRDFFAMVLGHLRMQSFLEATNPMLFSFEIPG